MTSVCPPPTSLPQAHPSLPSASKPPLLPHIPGCVVGRFLRRHKRFSLAVQMAGKEVWIHSNNSGSMLGLLCEGMPVMLSPATTPGRKLPYTQECVWMAPQPPPPGSGWLLCPEEPEAYVPGPQGFWVGVNTSVPNRMLSAAFAAGRLPFASGYSELKREAVRGSSRLDACLSGPNLPDLWVECKNVTMVEDNVACFPDAATERGQKHLRALMDIVRSGGRAVNFYLVQRPDGQCFGPAEVVDPVYAQLFWQAVEVGVEMRPFRATVNAAGIDLGEELPLARPCGHVNIS